MPHSQVASSDRGDSIDADTAKRAMNFVPGTIEIDLELEPVAYRYESWSEMADGWIELLRSTAETMPDPDHNQIRNVTPLVPVSEVEALVEQLVATREGSSSYESTNMPDDMF